MRVVAVSALLIALSCGSSPRECIGGSVRCGPICADTNVDPRNCGACGQACAMGEVCDAGTCVAECSAGETQCQSGCIDLATDPANCGACGSACAFENAAAVCNAGVCSGVCLGTFADCDKTGSCETDLATSPSSCGACSHDCLGGTCTDGKCDPIPVVMEPYGITAMAMTATDIVWTMGDQIRTIPKAGGTPLTLTSVNNLVVDIAADSANVYWAGFPGIQKCAIAGCNGTPVTLANTQGSQARHIATDGVNVYWTQDGVRSCAVGGCNGVPTTLWSAIGPNVIATDGKNVYWTDWNDVQACPVFGNCQPTPISNVGGVALALDATNLYITGFKLEKCSLATGCNLLPEVIWPDPSIAVAVDGPNIYWARDDNGTISRCAITNCTAPTILAIAQPSLRAIAVDGTWVYFVAGRSIRKLPK